MRKLLTGLFTATGLALAAVVPAQATANAAPPTQAISKVQLGIPELVQPGGPQHICDGNGAGSCKSLPRGGGVFNNAPVFAVGVNNGAWLWDNIQVGSVNGTTFTYQPIDNALRGQPILEIELHYDNSFCNANSAGTDVINLCFGSPAQKWVSDPQNNYLVNVGRSNDKNNWEVLCNPGNSGQLVIGTRDSCSDYHKQWATTS
jgi:hypothetical protein